MRGKRILLGITGSIAAYKSALLVRLLVKSGAEVKVVMTPSAKDFITPLTLSVLSKNPVLTEAFNPVTGEWYNHVELGLWSDLLIIAPASENTLAKMNAGICDNLLLAVYFSARCPVMIAPAMDLDMLKHAATQKNLKSLKSSGVKIIAPTDGELASGLYGEGRMEEPSKIFSILENHFKLNLPLKGKKALVTAGPTYESIDPVRFIGNRSSGKMGFAIAEELSRKGAEVTLVTGPSSIEIKDNSIRCIRVESADEMHQVCMKSFAASDIIIMAAAVADYKPQNPVSQKIKKSGTIQPIQLIPTKDILSEMGSKKTKKQLLIGFALESENELINAKTKLKKKNLDFIVLNSLKDKGAGFGHDTNKVTLLSKNGKQTTLPLKSKQAIAGDIISNVIALLKK